MAELQNGRSGAEGKGVGIAIVLVVAGTALAVTYVASDGMLFGQAAPAEPSAAASNNGQKNNVDVAGDATPSRNVFEGEPQDVRTSEEEVPAQLPDTSNTATTVTEKVVPEPDRSARTMSDEEMQELLAAKEFPWELVSEHATAADIQNILDEFVQM